MIKCNSCGFENIDGEHFCSQCFSDLDETLPESSFKCPHCGSEEVEEEEVFCGQCGGTLGGRASPHTSPEKCPSCKELLEEGDLVCGFCGTKIKDSSDYKEPDTSCNSSEVQPPAGENLLGKVKLEVEQGMIIGKQFLLSDPVSIMGRIDEEEGIYPDIDLTDIDDGYVHRKHAEISFRDNNARIFIKDFGGINKTCVNNKPIPPEEPVEIHTGDKIKLGKVTLRLKLHR